MFHARNDWNGRITDLKKKIPENEPVFMIRGQDKVGALTARIWAILNWVTGGSHLASKKVWVHARRMSNWPVKKSCDL